MDSEPTIFIVNDDAARRQSLVGLVRGVFPKVEGFDSPAQFCAACRAEQSGCLILDLALPGTSGLELQHALKKRGIDLPMIFFTGDGRVQTAAGAGPAAPISFLEKPAAQKELLNSIRTALEMDAENRRRNSLRQEVERRLSRLTAAEREVLDLVLEGKLNKEIASQLNLSVRTVEDRRARLMRKLEVASVAGLVRLVLGQ